MKTHGGEQPCDGKAASISQRMPRVVGKHQKLEEAIKDSLLLEYSQKVGQHLDFRILASRFLKQ